MYVLVLTISQPQRQNFDYFGTGAHFAHLSFIGQFIILISLFHKKYICNNDFQLPTESSFPSKRAYVEFYKINK